MQEMIVLGQVPGTNIQIDFTAWLYVAILVVMLLMLAFSRSKLRDCWHARIANMRARKALHLLSQYHLL